MSFLAPQWFLLLPVLVFIGWLRPAWRLYRPMRVLLMLCVLLALTQPTLQRATSGMDLWVLVDRSASANALTEPHMEEWRYLLERSKPSSKDRLHLLHYAQDITSDENADEITNRNSLTNTKLALLHATSLQQSERQGRVLLFSDGYSTGEVQSTLPVLTESRLPLDLRLLGEGVTRDIRVSALTVAPQVKSHEPFLISAQLEGASVDPVPVQLYRDGTLLSTKKIKFQDGEAQVEWVDRLAQNGSYQYKIQVIAPDDPIAGNNQAESWVRVTGGADVLLLSKYGNDPLVPILANYALEVDHITDPKSATAGRLSGYRAVIINNVPASDLDSEFLEALPFYIREQGGGVAMIGGQQAFGSGGYFQTSLDPLLPVSMELKDEHRKLSAALAIVMDRSGSMGMKVTGGQTKMQLANSGAATALELLGSMDEIAVLPVDSKAFFSIPLTVVGDKHEELTRKILDIRSSGGGIFVYNGLKAGWGELKDAKAGTKHIILFSDAMDTEQPAQYKKLLEEITDAGATVSVIGLGYDFDDDAELLKDIASRGNGRVFFTDEPQTLPQIFAQETVTIARSTFIEDVTGAVPTGKWLEISPSSLQWLSQVDGYNLCYLRPGATASLISKDEYQAPLVAHTSKGLGRTMAVTFPMGGEFSQRQRAWQAYGDFSQTLARWLVGLDTPAGLSLRSQQDGTSYRLELHYDVDEWSEKIALNAPELKTRYLDDRTGESRSWRRISPGLFHADLELEPGKPLQGIIQVGAHTLPFGPVGTSQSAEWDFDEQKRKALRNLSYQSGGRLLVDLKDAWKAPPIPMRQVILMPFLIVAVLLLLIDAFLTRTGWSPKMSKLSIQRDKSPRQVKVKRKSPRRRKPKAEVKPEPEQVTKVPESKSDLKSSLNRAKERR